MKGLITCSITLLLIITCAFNTAFGNEQSDRYFPDFQTDPDMPSVAMPQSFSDRGIQYGGWISQAFIDQRNSDDSLTTSTTSLRLYMKLFLWDNSYIYLRGKNIFTAVMQQDGFSYNTANNVADLDVGFIAMSTDDQSIRLYLGRKFFHLGTGLIMNGRGDGFQFDFYSRYVNITLFSCYTGLILKDNNVYGLSDKDISDGPRRLFAGTSFSFEFYNQTAYILGLGQIDYGKEYETQLSRYNSIYLGGGLKGVLLGNLTYYSEFIYEMGWSYLAGTTDLEKVSAFAFQFGLHYFFEAFLSPVVTFQYAFGSGDPDRNDYHSPTGNTGGLDTGFLYFGTYVGGYALRPLLANIHIFRLGGAFSPFAWTDVDFFQKMTFIAKYSYYLKSVKTSSINYGSDAIWDSRDIGHGIDISLRWRLYYDLAAYFNYGLFIPGEAYDEAEPVRHFMMLGCTMSF